MIALVVSSEEEQEQEHGTVVASVTVNEHHCQTTPSISMSSPKQRNKTPPPARHPRQTQRAPMKEMWSPGSLPRFIGCRAPKYLR
jgi:hypothetical protein